MGFKFFLLLCLTYTRAKNERDVIKEKIREASIESNKLADELEAMLNRIEDFRHENVEFTEEIDEEVKSEKQLQVALDNLGKVAEEIEKVAVAAETEKEIEIVNEMSEILDDVVIKVSVDEEEVSKNIAIGNNSGIEKRIKHIEDNIEKMLTALGEVISRLKGFSPSRNNILLANDIVKEHAHKKLKRRKNLKPRLPKQYDLDGSGDYEDYEDFSDGDSEDGVEENNDTDEESPDDAGDEYLDDEDEYIEDEDLNKDDPNEEENTNDNDTEDPGNENDDKTIIIRRKEKNDKNDTDSDNDNYDKDLIENDDEETCRDSTATNSVNVCVPDFETLEQPVEFHSQELKMAKHCFEVTKTICEESSEITTREVCVYPYRQNTEIAVAEVAKIAFEANFKKMKITKCPRYKTKDGTEEGKCVEDFVTKEYRIPTIDEYVEDIIELNVPEPISDCRSFKLNIPETICRDVTTTECAEVSYLKDFLFSGPVDGAILSKEGKCSPEVLTQQQQVCTLLKKPKNLKKKD